MQIANSFDKDTLKKILKGFLYSFLGGVSAGLTVYLQTNDLKMAVLTGISAVLVPGTAHAGVQYNKGE